MKISVEMEEIRRIRDANSLRRLSQTPNEFKREMKESVDWFVEAFGKSVKIVQSSDSVKYENTNMLRE